MGCTQSKIENEEAVSRCKGRKQFMKEAVSYRNAFAAAHSAYAMALKNTGAALSDYAHGEVQNPQFASSHPSATNPSAAATQTTFDTLPPPPPLPNFTNGPLQRAASMPEIKIPPKPEPKPTDPIIEEDEEDMENFEHSSHLKHRSRSNRNSGGGGSHSGGRSGNVVMENEDEDGPRPPPPPPRTVISQREPPPPPPPQTPPEAKGAWDFFFSGVENMPGPSLGDDVEEDVRIDKGEIERRAFEERSKQAEDGVAAEVVEGRRSVKGDVQVAEKVVVEPPVPPVVPVPAKNMKKTTKQVTTAVSAEGRRMGKGASNVNLLQIFTELDDHFLKASECAHEVSKMLEATRLHYHSNFADNRGHIDHSARVMRVITWNRSFRGPGLPNVDDGKDDLDAEENETHATVLDKLLAWEKKLFDEVKAGELMKFEYQKKVASLNKQKKHGSNSEALEKTKAAVSHLHTRYIVDMQSMDSTVAEINRLRDNQLYPKLVSLVDGMATMWQTMCTHHESQSKIVTTLRYLDNSQSQKQTSEHHHRGTLQLLNVVKEWHKQFENLMNHQKEYIKALNNWLKLNLVPIESSLKERVSSPPRDQHPPIQALLMAWHDYLEKLPDEVARSAVQNFTAVIETIVFLQKDEMKMRENCEETQKDLARKQRQFEEWKQKMQKRTADEMDPESTHKDTSAERQFMVESLKQKLAEEVEGYNKLCLQVREKSLASLKLRLPELFRAMSEFSHACSEMYSDLRSISERHNPSGSS
ncbi:hypothetical protein L1049_005117 [Liquidambar formosana]|uniref:Nitrate regulatory gene2 protein-like n=1 Tax=Liquidambar formosana TaxID=63359 RepID=A0AAP0X182_LIQFO